MVHHVKSMGAFTARHVKSMGAFTAAVLALGAMGNYILKKYLFKWV